MNRTDIKSPRRQRVVTFATHLLCLVILFVLPEVLFNYGRTQGAPAYIVYSKSFLYVVAFYVNYYFIVDNTVGKPRGVLRLVGYNTLLLLVMVAGLYVIMRTSDKPPRRGIDIDEATRLARHASFILRDVVMLVLTIALAVAIKLSDKWMKMEARGKEEEAVKRKQELDGLRSQLNPHFLFNTLNSIYALIDISPAKARDAVHELSRLLRYVLYENPSLVALGSEASFIENYVKLQRLRLPAGACLDLEVKLGDNAAALVPPMLFVTLIENVFKHADFSSPASISLEAAGEYALCTTRNKTRCDKASGGSGIGLVNLRRRLELLFGNNAALTATAAADDTFIVELKVPLSRQPQ